MAKMVSNYALNVMWITWTIPKASKCSFSDLKSVTDELRPYANISCQLWLMWMDGKWWIKSKFNPHGEVTRAQFGAILSRLLRWDKYDKAGWSRYEDHLDALSRSWIMKNTENPQTKELRWRVMVMLKRANDIATKK